MKRPAILFALLAALYLLAALVDPCDNAPGCNPTTINNQ
jgi:hypothetical protein